MNNVYVESIKNIQINNEVCEKIKLNNKKDVSKKAWSYLYELLKEYNINLLEEEIIYINNQKPYIKNNPIYFNISHSNNMIAIVIADTECSIDIEYINMNKNHDKIVNKLFSNDEQLIYSNHPHKLEYFYELWTKKESCFKLTGEGIKISKFSEIQYSNNIISYLFINDNERYFISYIIL